MSVIDDIIKALQGKKTPQEASILIEQLLKEKSLYDAFRSAGLTPTIDDLQSRTRERLGGIMSLVEKVNLIDLIEKINLISEITHIGTIDTISSIASILTLNRITQIDKLNPESREAFVNAGFETGVDSPWTKSAGVTGVTNYTARTGSYSFKFESGVSPATTFQQLFNPPFLQKRDISAFNVYTRGISAVGGAIDKLYIIYNGGLLSLAFDVGGGYWGDGWLLDNLMGSSSWTNLPSTARIEGVKIESATIAGYGNYYDDFTLLDSYYRNVVVDRVGRVDESDTYGNLGLLPQRPTTLDLYAQLRSAGVEIDPRDIIDRVARELGQVSLGTSTGKSNVLKTGNLVTTTTTADQVILTYTVTTGKTFYLEYIMVSARLTTFATTATLFGTASLESPATTKLITQDLAEAGRISVNPIFFSEPIPIASGTVIRLVCTPSATTSMTWKANFGGYEK